MNSPNTNWSLWDEVYGSLVSSTLMAEGTQMALLGKLWASTPSFFFFFSFLETSFKKVSLEVVSQRTGKAPRAATVITKTPNGPSGSLLRQQTAQGPMCLKQEPGGFLKAILSRNDHGLSRFLHWGALQEGQGWGEELRDKSHVVY